MKPLVFKWLALAVVLTGTAVPSRAEDLDAALAAQKKSAQRRVYSESALVEDHNLSVPRTETEEERLLDKKLREMDERAVSIVPAPNQPARALAPPKPDEDKNWLTTAIISEPEPKPETDEEAWAVKEMVRKKTEADALKAREASEKLLRAKPQQSSTVLPAIDRLKKYQLDSKNTRDDQDQGNTGFSYGLPDNKVDPLAAIRPPPKKEAPPPLFSPQAAKGSPSINQSPLQPVRSPLNNPLAAGSPTRNAPTPAGVSSGFNHSEPTPLTPLQMIKKSSPINRQDPFAEERIPRMKSSIWE